MPWNPLDPCETVITGATNYTNTTPIRAAIGDATLQTGDIVTISGVEGNTAANGTWFLLNDGDGDGYALLNSSGNGDFEVGVDNPGVVTVYPLNPDNSTETQRVYGAEIDETGILSSIDVSTTKCGYVPFTIIGHECTTEFRVATVDGGGVETGEYEVFMGTYYPDTNTIQRIATVKTSEGGESAIAGMTPITFGAGTKVLTYTEVLEDLEPNMSRFTPNYSLISVDARIRDLEDIGSDTFPWRDAWPRQRIRPFVQGFMTSAKHIDPSRGTKIAQIPEIIRDMREERQLTISRHFKYNTWQAADGERWLNTDPGIIRLYWQGEYGGRSYARYFDMPICKVDFKPINRLSDPPIFTPEVIRSEYAILNLDAPSIPFRFNTSSHANQDSTIAGRPADVFAYVRSQYDNPGNTSFVEACADRGQFRLGLFYVNWYTDTARNDGAESNRKGHELKLDNDGWIYLDAGTFSADANWITDASPGKRADRRYLYMGTISGFQNGRATCAPGARLVWNYWNRTRYSDTLANYAGDWDGNMTHETLLLNAAARYANGVAKKPWETAPDRVRWCNWFLIPIRASWRELRRQEIAADGDPVATTRGIFYGNQEVIGQTWIPASSSWANARGDGGRRRIASHINTVPTQMSRWNMAFNNERSDNPRRALHVDDGVGLGWGGYRVASEVGRLQPDQQEAVQCRFFGWNANGTIHHNDVDTGIMRRNEQIYLVVRGED